MRCCVHSIRLLAVVLTAGFCLAAGVEAPSPSGERMLNDVKILASDEYEGRGIGTEGLAHAGEYIAESFRNSGLEVTIAGGDPYQEFTINDGAKLGEPNALKFVGPDDQEISLTYDSDFRTCAFGGSGRFDASLVFAGYGINAPDAKYNDFENVDVHGKVVVVIRRTPQQDNPHGPFSVETGISRHAALTTKLSEAFSAGAAAVLIVNDVYTGRHETEELNAQLADARQQIVDLSQKFTQDELSPDDLKSQLKERLTHLQQVQELVSQHQLDPLMEFGYGGSRQGESIPCFHISQKVCNELLVASTGSTLAELEMQIDTQGAPVSAELAGWKAVGEAEVEVVKVPTRNVIGVLEGAGEHADETIVVGAHFDHLGHGGNGSLSPDSHEIHNGADDNASGTAGLLELARRLGEREQPLPRRVVFIAFSGEERGLLGSAEYIEHPLYPLENTVAMLNMDMIGRMEDETLTIFGVGTSSRWDQLIDKDATDSGLRINKNVEGFGPSDHASFYARKIPVLHFFTGTHSDYHRPSDDWEKINVAGMVQVVDLLEQILLDTAQTAERPDYVNVPGTAIVGRSGNRPYFGSIPDFGGDAPGYKIQGASPESPADKAGLKAGDVIVKLGENKIGGLDDFDLALRKFSAGQEVPVTVLRDGQEVELKVTLAQPRG